MADENTPDENDVEAAMAAAMGEEAGGDAGAGDGNIDEMLEAEMLKAMQSDTGGGGAAGMVGMGGGSMMGVDAPEGIERLSDVDVFVTVEIGGTQIPIKDIMEWTRDSIVELEPEENDPVEVMVNGKLFAHGEVVVVGDTFAVRIVELIDPHEEPSFDSL